MTVLEPGASDPQLERELDHLLGALGVQYEKARHNNEAGGWIEYTIHPRPGLDLRLDFELYTDQLNVNFNGCYLMLEAAAHMPKLRRNPNAFEEWRTHSLRLVRDILTSTEGRDPLAMEAPAWWLPVSLGRERVGVLRRRREPLLVLWESQDIGVPFVAGVKRRRPLTPQSSGSGARVACPSAAGRER